VVLDDGHYTAEEILVDQPDRFGYMVSGYTGYRGLMIDHAIGDFRYADEGARRVWNGRIRSAQGSRSSGRSSPTS
jgi:hypothetical protein